MDEYYYYAVCIFLISFFSIATTVLETKSVSSAEEMDQPPKLMLWQTMSRLREISLFECDVRVLRNGFCEFIQCIILLIGVNWSYLQGGPFPPKSWFLVMCMNFPTHPLTRSRVTASCCQGTALWMKACLLVRTKPKTLIFLYTSNSNRWIRPRV